MILWGPKLLWDLYDVVRAWSVVGPLRCGGSLECYETSMMFWEPGVLWDLYDVVGAYGVVEPL